MSFELNTDSVQRYLTENNLRTPEKSQNRARPGLSIYSRIDAETLDKIVACLLQREPFHTVKELHRAFFLAERGVPYSTFHRFARRVRIAADLERLDPEAPLPPAIADRLPDLIAELLVEVCTRPEPASRTVYRLSFAFRAITNALIARRQDEHQRELAAKEAATRSSRAEFAVLSQAARDLRATAQAREVVARMTQLEPALAAAVSAESTDAAAGDG